MKLKRAHFKLDMRPIDEDCECTTCKTYTRSYLHHIVRNEEVAATLLTVHNVAFQLKLMKDMRTSIIENRFPKFVKDFMARYHHNEPIPQWAIDALKLVNIQL